MNFHLTEQFQNQVKKLCTRDIKLRASLKKQFSLFQKNHCHPSLKFHKLKGERSDQYAMWIKGDLRALCIKDGEMYIFFDLVTHDQY